jgi:hypothetical protein
MSSAAASEPRERNDSATALKISHASFFFPSLT